MIHDEIVGYDLAKLAKKKGFNEPTTLYYTADGVRMGCYAAVYHNFTYSDNIAAPTQSLLQKWLREEKGVHIFVDYYHPTKQWDSLIIYMNRIPTIKNNCKFNLYKLYNTYELALEDALKFALKNLI